MASFLGFAMPVFWLALMLQILFTEFFLRTGVRVFYTSGLNSVDNSCTFCVDRAQHLAIPVMTLAVLSVAQYSRYMRASMLEVINSDYIRTARAKGLPEQKVTIRHALRNALIPVVTVSAINFGVLIGGAVITETIFAWPGLGRLTVQALLNRDFPVVLAAVFFISLTYTLVNLAVDLLYGWLDPRVRLQ
jgi:peptide/nickel transport system permease protein